MKRSRITRAVQVSTFALIAGLFAEMPAVAASPVPDQVITAGQQPQTQAADSAVSPKAETAEIVVTAQKRSERLRDVPMSISAASSQQ